MQRVYPLATLFDVFVRGLLPLRVWIDEFTSDLPFLRPPPAGLAIGVP